jgi:DNA repair exonuclease SbcCD nuclease subunit
MAEIRILHTSDLHLDASFRATGVPSERARERCLAHLQSFDRTVDKAVELEADLLLIAGDLFEDQHARPATGRHVARRLADWGRPVFIAPGNHDPFHPRSLYALLDWPDNVRVFRGAWQTHALPELGVQVHGRGFESPEENAPLVEGLQVTGDGLHVVVAHGSDVSSRPDRHHPYRPFKPQELEGLPVDYVALGHFHRYAQLPTQRVCAVYCGSPIPQGYNETGDHGVVLARLQADRIDVELHALPARRFVTRDVDVTGCETQAEVVQRAERETVRHANDFLRLRLQGSLPPDLDVDVAGLQEALAGLVHDVEVKDHTVPEYEFEALASEATVRGLFVRTLLEDLEGSEGSERERVRRALYFGLDAFAGRPQAR